jgi:hypothetical protein
MTDSGTARISRHSYRAKVLFIEAISQPAPISAKAAAGGWSRASVSA